MSIFVPPRIHGSSPQLGADHGLHPRHSCSPPRIHRLPLFLLANPLHDGKESSLSVQDASNPHRPTFRPRHETKPIELFYDLFFMANLTVFSIDHEINNGSTLKSYVGFFTLLWFTWFQVTLFDARFSIDSVFERCCKASQFGVMTGFGVVGPNYQKDSDYKTMQALSLVLMVSRWILVGQYATVLWFARKQKTAILPLILQLGTLIISAVIFLGLSFSFNESRGFSGQIGWYIVLVFESLSLLSISSYWSSFSFRRTCLTDRVGLLTLIMIGEGIIGFSKTLSKIAGSFASTSMLAGQAVSAVLITYFLFHLYFDHVNTDSFGTIRQHIWAVLHYPLNIALILTLAGVNQLALFSVAQQQVTAVEDLISAALTASVGDRATIVGTINDTVNALEADFASSPPIPGIIEAGLIELLAGNITDNDTDSLGAAVVLFLLQSYGYDVTSYTPDALGPFVTIIISAYIYFFISAGAALLILATLLWLGKKKTSVAEWGCVGVRVVIGTGLCLITLMLVTYDAKSTDGSTWGVFVLSGWLLPTVVLCYGFVLIMDKVFPFFLPRRDIVSGFVGEEVHPVMERKAT